VSGVLPWVGVATLGAAGALLRFRVDAVVSRAWPTAFPIGTFTVNLTGGFALGLLVGIGLDDDVMLAVGTGLLGGYTTFSTWMFEAQRLAEDGELRLVWLYLAGSLAAGAATTGLGWLLGGALG
jgi:CrcB protein